MFKLVFKPKKIKTYSPTKLIIYKKKQYFIFVNFLKVNFD